MLYAELCRRHAKFGEFNQVRILEWRGIDIQMRVQYLLKFKALVVSKLCLVFILEQDFPVSR